MATELRLGTATRTSALDVPAPTAITVALAVALVLPAPALVVASIVTAVVAMWSRADHGGAPSLPAARDLTLAASALAATAATSSLLHPHGADTGRLVVQFALLALVAGTLANQRSGARSLAALWGGVTAAATAAGGLAVVQVLVLGEHRAEGPHANAIVFGNLALLAAGLSIALADHAPQRELAGRLTVVAAASGVVASVLSGSRGGWLAVPVVAVVLHRRADRTRADRSARPDRTAHGRRIGPAAVALIALAALAAVTLGRGMPVERLTDTVSDVTGYVGAGPDDPGSGTTIGARFEAWRSAVTAFADEPVLGIGWGNLQEHFRDEVRAGDRHDRIATFTHAHQQLLGALASGGIVGAAAMAAIVAVPAVHFRRAWRSADPLRRSVGRAGLVVVTAYGVFGLTEAIFEHVVGVGFYALTVGALVAALPRPALSGELGPDVDTRTGGTIARELST